MTIKVTKLPDAEPRDRHVAIGVFDGVHRGHQAVIDEADTVLTFDPHPLSVINPDAAPKLIMPFDVKRDVIDGLGVEEVVVIPFDREFMKIPAEEFISEILVRRLGAKKVSVGENFRFGTKAKVRAHVDAFFRGLKDRTEEVKTRCRTVLQAQSFASATM